MANGIVNVNAANERAAWLALRVVRGQCRRDFFSFFEKASARATKKPT
jgi:hypothetical protein